MPRRWAHATLLGCGLLALAVVPSALGQGGGIDKVTFRDRTQDGKIVTVDGETKESAKGVDVVTGGKTKNLSPADVIRIDYGVVTGVQRGDQLKALSIEDSKDAAKAQAEYADLIKKAGAAAPEKTRRFLQFREAYWATKIADAKTGDDFKTEATKAVDKLSAVGKISKKSWEIWPIARTQARLLNELGEYGKAAEVLGDVASVPDLPRDLKFEARLAEAAALIRAGQGLGTEGILDQLEKDKDFPAGPLKDRLAVLRAATKLPKAGGDQGSARPAIAKLEEAIAQAKDPVARAIGYNFLGDVQLAQNSPRDAMWAYLWTDTVYNTDRDEQLIAVHRLIKLFEAQKDKDRADQFRDKLPRLR